MSFKEWITYLIQKMVWFMETPRQERKAIRQAQKIPWSVHWFGLIPFSMKMVYEQRREKWKRS